MERRLDAAALRDGRAHARDVDARARDPVATRRDGALAQRDARLAEQGSLTARGTGAWRSCAARPPHSARSPHRSVKTPAAQAWSPIRRTAHTPGGSAGGELRDDDVELATGER